MKKILVSTVFIAMFYNNGKACADYDPDYEYFNLFTQSIIRDKNYIPFLHTYSSRFYDDGRKVMLIDDNIETWQKYFGNALNYKESEYLVNHMSMNELNIFKKGNSANPILNKLGTYQKFSEGIDYLIEAKYLEPFMRINYVENPDAFYYRENEDDKNATQLDYNKTVSALTSLYNAAKNSEIKARYGYQLIRFNHYTRNYEKAVDAFKTFVEPLNVKTSPYYLALDQLAGAQRGLKMNDEANWNFFQVFKNMKARKESAFVSMKLSDSASFENILKKTSTPEEKNMAYFLLGYDDFTNPIPMMEKMYEINPDSEILKVMAARSINELERNYLPLTYPDNISEKQEQKNAAVKQDTLQKANDAEKESFWDKILGFFQNLFGSKKEGSSESRNIDQSDKELLNNPERIPVFSANENYWTGEKQKDFLADLENLTAKTKEKSKDEFWQIADAYLKFLKKDFKESNSILSNIKTANPEYKEQIERMKILNDIVAQPRIDAAFEEHLTKDYPKLFEDKKQGDSTYYSYYYHKNDTSDFIRDVLANRYFIQGEDAKSYLMSNNMSDLQYNPNSFLVKKVEEFYRKPNKTSFERNVVARNINDVGSVDDFFNLIYGDREMKLANFDKAKSFYSKITNFKGIPRNSVDWTEDGKPVYTPYNYGDTYDGFKNIPNLVFGHNVWESFQSPDEVSMKAENYAAFPFIKPQMNKLELTDAAIQLKKIGAGTDANSGKANQLLGNLLYNTSILGYYRELFVMDIDNSNGGKFDFWTTGEETPYHYYYKDFLYHTYVEPDNFDLALNYYGKALKQTADKEQQARILFQMASAEQGKYYQWEAQQQSNIDYSDPKWSEKNDAFRLSLDKAKNEKYRSYFTQLKSQYATTQTAKSLMGSCSYFDYFMKKQ